MCTKRKRYQHPTMSVIALQQSSALLTESSDVKYERNDYGNAEVQTWD